MGESRSEEELVPVSADEAAPLILREYRPALDKSPAQSTAEWRKAAACAMTFDEKMVVFRVLFQLSAAGNVSAATLLLNYGMGKPGVGAAGKLMDDVAADSVQARLQAKLGRLPPEKKKDLLELIGLLDGPDEADGPVTVDGRGESPCR